MLKKLLKNLAKKRKRAPPSPGRASPLSTIVISNPNEWQSEALEEIENSISERNYPSKIFKI